MRQGFMGRNAGDADSQAIIMMDRVMAAVDDGKLFKARVTGTIAAVAGGVTSYLLCEIITPNSSTKKVHLVGAITTHALTGEVFFIEAPTITDGSAGTVTPINMNRESGRTPDTVMWSDPTAISAGTTLEDFLVSAGVTNWMFTAKGWKWKLKPNTKYVIKVSNASTTTAAIVTLDLFFIEEDGEV